MDIQQIRNEAKQRVEREFLLTLFTAEEWDKLFEWSQKGVPPGMWMEHLEAGEFLHKIKVLADIANDRATHTIL